MTDLKWIYRSSHRFYIDLTREVPEMVYWNRRIDWNEQRVRLTAHPNCEPLSDENTDRYTYEYRKERERIRLENKRMKEEMGLLPKAISSDAMAAKESDYRSASFIPTYIHILKKNNIKEKTPWYDAVHNSGGVPPYVPIWDVEVTFDDAHCPDCNPELRPQLHRPYKGKLGFHGMYILLDDGKPLLVRKTEYAHVKVVDVSPNAINFIRARVDLWKQYKNESGKKAWDKTLEDRTWVIQFLAESLRTEVHSVSILPVADPDSVGRLTWNKSRESSGMVETVNPSDWSSDESIKENLNVWFNVAHPIFEHIEKLWKEPETMHIAECYIWYLFYRLILKEVGIAYFDDHPQKRAELRGLEELVEEDYGLIRV